MTDHTSYVELEKQHLAGADNMVDGEDMPAAARRITARTQAGFNYALGQEVLTQGTWFLDDAANGLAHATFCSWLSLISAVGEGSKEKLVKHLRKVADAVADAADEPEEHLTQFDEISATEGGRA